MWKEFLQKIATLRGRINCEFTASSSLDFFNLKDFLTWKTFKFWVQCVPLQFRSRKITGSESELLICSIIRVKGSAFQFTKLLLCLIFLFKSDGQLPWWKFHRPPSDDPRFDRASPGIFWSSFRLDLFWSEKIPLRFAFESKFWFNKLNALN